MDPVRLGRLPYSIRYYQVQNGIRLRSFNRDEHPDEDYTFAEIQEQQIVILGHVFWWGMFAR